MAKNPADDTVDLKALPLEDLHALKRQVEGRIAAEHQERKKAALVQIRKIIADNELTYDDVLPTIKRNAKRKKAIAVYRNPAKPRQTWSGIGDPPSWFTSAKDKEALRITD